VGLRAPHPRFLFWRKRGTRKQRHALFGQIPNDCRFSWRRSQSGSLRSHGSAYSLLVQRTAPFTRPEKRQGDLTSFATVACGEPLGCAPFSLQPEPRVVRVGRLQKQPYSISYPTLHASQLHSPPCQRGVARRRRDGGIPGAAKPHFSLVWSASAPSVCPKGQTAPSKEGAVTVAYHPQQCATPNLGKTDPTRQHPPPQGSPLQRELSGEA